MKVHYAGHEFEVAPEPADYWQWVREGRYDAEWQTLLTHMRPEQTFVDLGAWVGSHSMLASTICRLVIAVEPDPVAYEILLANTWPCQLWPPLLGQQPCAARNPKIEPYRLAVGKSGAVKLGSGLLGASTTRENPSAGGGIGAWEEGQTFEARSVALRDLVGPLDMPLFIKIDIEGSEEHVVKDLDFFREYKPAVYIELHPWWWANPKETWECMYKLGEIYGQPTTSGSRKLMLHV